jgi:hypothetical protein
VDEEEDFDNMTLQQYVEMYKQPLSQESMEAIEKLTEVVTNKQKKKKGVKEKEEEKKTVQVGVVNEGKQKVKKRSKAIAALAAGKA